jgi:hypothetical protein
VVLVAGYAWYTARWGPGVLRWVFRIPFSHPQEWRRLPDVLLFCLLIAPALPYLLATRRRNPALRLLLWPLLGTGLAGLAAFLKAGGVPNSLLGPGYLLALCTGFILEDAFTAPVDLRPALLGLLLLVVAIMGPGRGRLYTGAFPDASDRAAMDEFAQVVRTLPGDQIFMPFNGLFVARAAGKPPPPFFNSIFADRHWAHLPPPPEVTAGLQQGRYDDLLGPLYQLQPLVGSQYLFLGTLVRLDPHPYDAADSMDRGNFPRQLWVRRDLWTPDNRRRVEALLTHLQYLGWLPAS